MRCAFLVKGVLIILLFSIVASSVSWYTRNDFLLFRPGENL